jgi:hypothetical protein
MARMAQCFPELRFHRRGSASCWLGPLQPLPGSAIYQVRVTWRDRRAPDVRVEWPAIRRDAPHLYGPNRLCLFYPTDRSWRPELYIANTIVPWAAEWLLFYEYWLDTGTWYGPEAPHQPKTTWH